MNAQIAQILIIVHAILGGLALLSGAIALIYKKGSTVHVKAGKAFYWEMFAAIVLSLVIAVLPDHESMFLFTVGVFSSYFTLSGRRFLRYKKQITPKSVDYILSVGILICGLLMHVVPYLLYGKLNIVLSTFGVGAIIIGIRDLRLYKRPEKLKANYLSLHLGNMIGGYISATTAFFVVNDVLPGVYNWFVPGLIFGFYITYWNIKLSKKRHGQTR